jgi:hypothetical protein
MASHNPQLSRTLILWTCITCAVVATLALQILLSERGIQLAEIWREVSANKLRVGSAMAWWVVAGSGFLVGAVVSYGLGVAPPPWRRYRLLRWVIGIVVVFALAHVARHAGPPEGVSAALYLVSTTAAIVAAALMAVVGAFFALRR